uniref:Uncharacterized protein n=1 Tax=Arundo donax TaxID=35708 RepID=A0A0A9C3V1_ARUDO
MDRDEDDVGEADPHDQTMESFMSNKKPGKVGRSIEQDHIFGFKTGNAELVNMNLEAVRVELRRRKQEATEVLQMLIADPGSLEEYRFSFEEAVESIKAGEVIKLGDLLHQSNAVL